MIEVLHTPGHTPDSLCFVVPDGVFTGDTIKSGSTVVVDDMSDYMATLERLAGLRVDRIYPGHGDLIDEPARVISEYIEHRLMREAAIVAALADGPREVSDVVEVAYPGLDPALVPLATQSTTAHLEKLVVDGVAETDGRTWRLC